MPNLTLFFRTLAVSFSVTAVGFSAAPSAGPVGKLFVADLQGDVKIETKDKITEMTKRASYSAEGTIIESAKATGEQADRQHASMVYSNGTGLYFAPATRLEVRKFSQEPFAANRTDLDVEPSIAQTLGFLARGTIGLCTSRQVAGSSMVYTTPHGSITVLGRRVIIDVTDDYTKVYALEGDYVIRASAGGTNERTGQTLHVGEQAILRPEINGGKASVEIEKIPQEQRTPLETKVALACLARRTVFFDSVDGNNGPETTAVDVMSADLPKQFTVSPARLE